MRKIYLLTDYKNRFGSRYNDVPYRSGMDKELLTDLFRKNGFEAIYKGFHDVDFSSHELEKELVLYTSSEDYGYYYKSYIEDIVYGLEQGKSNVIPSYKLLRANNNKVFMEIMRDQLHQGDISSIKSHLYGTLEELMADIDQDRLDYPVVLKPAAGAMSEGVSLARNAEELIKQAKKISGTKDFMVDLKDIGRQYKHKGYIRESTHRMKFIVQNFIPGLENDHKILIFGNKYYVIKRRNRKDDFRASGGGLLSYEENLPDGILDFAQKVYDILDVPQLSIDLAFDGTRFHLFEFQAVYFGSYTLTFSEFHFVKNNNNQWIAQKGNSILEKEYVDSTVLYINNKFI